MTQAAYVIVNKENATYLDCETCGEVYQGEAGEKHVKNNADHKYEFTRLECI